MGSNEVSPAHSVHESASRRDRDKNSTAGPLRSHQPPSPSANTWRNDFPPIPPGSRRNSPVQHPSLSTPPPETETSRNSYLQSGSYKLSDRSPENVPRCE